MAAIGKLKSNKARGCCITSYNVEARRLSIDKICCIDYVNTVFTKCHKLTETVREGLGNVWFLATDSRVTIGVNFTRQYRDCQTERKLFSISVL